MRYKIDSDRNGNKVLKIKPVGGRMFSIQTNGNLPDNHRMPYGWYTPDALQVQEILHYIQDYGTKYQKEIFKYMAPIAPKAVEQI